MLNPVWARERSAERTYSDRTNGILSLTAGGDQDWRRIVWHWILVAARGVVEAY